MRPLRHINRYTIRNAMPTILTATACIGVLLTGVTSARAMYKYMKKMEEPCDNVMEAVKVAILPSAIGCGTIASFIFARKADKAVIAGLSASVASLSAQLHETNAGIRELYKDDKDILNEKIRRYVEDMGDEVIVIDPEGELYYDETSDAAFCVRPTTLQDAKYKLNRNYQLRDGWASLYEFYRFLGMTKRQIHDHGLDWSRYVGWHAEEMVQDGIYWIDSYEDIMKTGFNIIGFMTPIMPICCDPPEVALDRCKWDERDLGDRWWLDTADDVEKEIAMQICDNLEE